MTESPGGRQVCEHVSGERLKTARAGLDAVAVVCRKGITEMG